MGSPRPSQSAFPGSKLYTLYHRHPTPYRALLVRLRARDSCASLRRPLLASDRDEHDLATHMSPFEFVDGIGDPVERIGRRDGDLDRPEATRCANGVSTSCVDAEVLPAAFAPAFWKAAMVSMRCGAILRSTASRT